MANATDPNVLALQTAVSRFSGTVSGISAVNADGVMTPDLVTMVQAALAYIAANDQTTDANGNAVSQDATALQAQLTSQQALQQSASGVATFLNQGADDLNLGGSNLNIIPSGIPGAQAANNLINAALGLPTWAKIAGGLALVFVVWQIGAMIARRSRHHGLHGALLGDGSQTVEVDEFEEVDYIDV